MQDGRYAIDDVRAVGHRRAALPPDEVLKRLLASVFVAGLFYGANFAVVIAAWVRQSPTADDERLLQRRQQPGQQQQQQQTYGSNQTNRPRAVRGRTSTMTFARAPGVIASLTMTLERVLCAPLCLTIDHLDGIGLFADTPWLRVPIEPFDDATKRALTMIWTEPIHYFDAVESLMAGAGRRLCRFRYDAHCEAAVPREALARAIALRFVALGARAAARSGDDRVLIECVIAVRAAVANLTVALDAEPVPTDETRAVLARIDADLRRPQLLDVLRAWCADTDERPAEPPPPVVVVVAPTTQRALTDDGAPTVDPY